MRFVWFILYVDCSSFVRVLFVFLLVFTELYRWSRRTSNIHKSLRRFYGTSNFSLFWMFFPCDFLMNIGKRRSAPLSTVQWMIFFPKVFLYRKIFPSQCQNYTNYCVPCSNWLLRYFGIAILDYCIELWKSQHVCNSNLSVLIQIKFNLNSNHIFSWPLTLLFPLRETNIH